MSNIYESADVVSEYHASEEFSLLEQIQATFVKLAHFGKKYAPLAEAGYRMYELAEKVMKHSA